MSYEADAHVVQMKVLRYLLHVPFATFSQLRKDADVQSDHFTFHIKQLTAAGLIHKTDDGYRLTGSGKEYANRMDTDNNVIEKQPKISVVLIIEHEGKYLHQERLKHPYYGYWGFATGKVRWGETLLEAGARELEEETGLSADLRILGFYHKMDYEEVTKDLLEDKYFALIYGVNPTGDFINDMEGHHNEWLTPEEFDAIEKKFGSVDEIRQLAHGSHQTVTEHKFYYSSSDY